MPHGRTGPVLPPQQLAWSGQVAACYFLLGAGVLAPWNALLSAADYNETLFPGRHVDRLLTVAYLPVCCVLQGVTMRFSEAWPGSPRILTAFAGFAALMLALPLVDRLLVGSAEHAPDAMLVLLVVTTMAVGVLDGLSQGAIFADAAQLPPQYTHAVVAGTASSGVVISLARIATKAALPQTRAGLRASTAVYFGLTGLLEAACFWVFHSVMPRLGVVRFYRRRHYAPRDDGTPELELSPQPSILEAESAAHLGLGDDQQPLCRQGGNSTPDLQDQHLLHSAACASDAQQQHDAEVHEQQQCSKPRLSWQHVLVEARHSVLAVFTCYVVTLALFPGVLAEDIKSALLGDWLPVLLIALFNILDFTGKCVPFGKTLSQRTLLGAALARGLFVPAFWFAGRRGLVALVAALTALLGFSNGLLTALVMTLAPQAVETGEAGLVEHMLVFALVLGLTVGALAGWLWLL